MSAETVRHYTERFDAFRAERAAGDPPWLAALRENALQAFAERGFPSRRDEEWRYTNLAPLTKVGFELPPDGSVRVTRDDVESLSIPVFACTLFVFVDGRYAPELSTPPALAREVVVESLATLRAEAPERIEPHLGGLVDAKAHPFAALNTAFLDDGAVLLVPESVQLESPMHVVFLSTDAGRPAVQHPRVLVAAGAGSRATVIQDHVALDGAAGFTNAVTEVTVGRNARVDLVNLQRESGERFHVSSCSARIERDGRFASHVVTVGGRLVRNDLSALLAGEGADCTLNGLFVAADRQLVDNHTTVDHAMPHGTSRELYKGVLADSARGVFRGRVIVRPDAQKTDATQSNPNLLLSDRAEIDTKPQLEIHADDVKCSHGSAIGQLDRDALFYLRTRAIDEPAARALLTRAFASEAAAAIPVESLRDEIDVLIEEKLPLMTGYDPARARADFPLLDQEVHGKPLVFLDSAASAQKPRQVIDAMARFQERDYANIHRGVYAISQRATDAYEGAREKVRAFLNAAEAREIVFVRGTTEAINLVAQSYGRTHVGRGDEVLITHLEHHSNIVPWQMLCEEKGATLRVAPIDDRGQVVRAEFERLLSPRTKIAAFSHVSNALGTINPVEEMVRLCHARGVPALVDGAQAVPHQAVDVRAIDCDFYAFSGHKLFGPSGIGVLYGKAEHLEAMPPWQGGGEMILSVRFDGTTFNEIPHKFEAGTPHITGAVGLGAAIDYVTELGLGAVAAYEHELLEYASKELGRVPGLRLIGTAERKAAVASFVLDGVHPHDAGTILDREGIAVRAGHHCAQPAMDRFGVPATIRASFALYNTRADVDALVRGLHAVREVFA